jgi:hypothetical protein
LVISLTADYSGLTELLSGSPFLWPQPGVKFPVSR